ncbi:MAG: 50S ribosomal protein L9 [Candidatus Magasanikbacteria bacterium]|nr:50S ribosomal protein L9 [Candidatus Magasanikbacteria bacterium]
MKVILIQNVPNFGKIDDIKEVSEGYARNFLFAKNLAVAASPNILKEIEARRNRKLKNTENELREQQAIAQRLDGREFTLKEKTSAAGALYAAVGPQKILEILKKSGFTIDKDKIAMKPIKEAGEYKAKIKFSYGLEAEIIVNVIKL